MLSDLLYRLRVIFRQDAVEEELDQELRFHLEHQVAAFMKSGLSRDEAIRRARSAFGGLDQIKEECRQARGVAALEITIQDLRYGIRGMSRNPVFTLTAVLTLALTTAAVSTIFNLANTLLFRHLPVDHPEAIVVVSATRQHGHVLGPLSYPDYVRFRDQNKTLKGLAAHYSTAPLFVTANNNSKEINGAVVSASLFPLLGVKPARGRFFRQDEDSVPDRDRVAVLGYDLWRNWFGSSPDALGSVVKVNGITFTVIGVAPQTFRGVSAMPSEIYIPTMMLRVGYRGCDDSLAENCTILDMIGRLAEGHKVEEAKAEMVTLVPPRWAQAAEDDNTGVTVFREGTRHNEDDVRLVSLLVLVAGVLMVVCCANLAGLLIARGSARTREFAIRISLGAGRFRLVRQLMTESLLLAVLGGILGTLISLALTSLLKSMFYSFDAEGHPLYFDFSLEPVVVFAVLAVSLAAGFLFGLVPGVKASRSGPTESLKRQASGVSTRSRFGHWLVGTQAAIAVALVGVAALLMASARILATGTNFESSHVALMRLRPRLIKYPPEKAQQFQRAVVQRLEAIPGVESVSIVYPGAVLLGMDAEVSLPEWPDPTRQAIPTGYIEVGTRYFETLRTPVLRGREFNDRDSANSPPVAIVNQTLARHLWPAGNAIGGTLVVNRHPH